MSTYAIADAINNLADNLKYAIGARNQTEKDKLEFEKEKFEFYRAFEEEKLKLSNYDNCDHKWISHGAAMITVESPTTPIGCYEYLICEKCGTHMLRPYAPHTFKT